MRNADRKVWRGLLALGLVTVLLAGACSSGTSTETGTDSTASTGGEGDATTVNRDGTLKWGFDLTQNGQFSWEPGANSSHPSLDPLWYLVYGRLMYKAEDGSFVPDLAEKVTVVDSGTIDIVLRPDQTWQDGAPFDAASVKAGLDHNLATDPTKSGFTQAFYSPTVSVVDPTTVRLTFADNTAASWYDSFITASPSTITRPGDYSGIPVGAGPMKITSYTPDTTLTMERYDGFWNAEEVGFAGVDVVQIGNGQVQSSTAALQSGQADIATFDSTQLAALSGPLEPAILQDPSRLMRMGTCKRDTPLDNADIRRAISNAIDRDALNDVVFEGTATKATQLWPEDNRFYSPEVGDELDYDLETAKQLVADSGISNPTFDLYVLDNLGLPDAATVIEQQLAAAGITANIIVTPDLVNQFLTPKAPGATIFPATPNPGLLKLKDFNGTATSNLCNWEDERLQALFDEISQIAPDTEEAQQAWWEVEEIYAEGTLGVPLLFASVVGGYNTDRLEMGSIFPGGLSVLPDIYNSYIISE